MGIYTNTFRSSGLTGYAKQLRRLFVRPCSLPITFGLFGLLVLIQTCLLLWFLNSSSSSRDGLLRYFYSVPDSIRSASGYTLHSLSSGSRGTKKIQKYIPNTVVTPAKINTMNLQISQMLSDSIILSPANWTRIGEYGRLYQTAYNMYAQIVLQKIDNQTRKQFEARFFQLEDKLYPWFIRGPVYQSALHSAFKSNSAGIVMTTGTKYALVAKHTITMLRHIGSKLPIQIMYCGESDLTKSKRLMLSELPGVELVDLKNILNIDKCSRGWENKPFAVMASKFRHVLLIDSDTLFLQPPETIFQMPEYVKTGAFLFRDRTLADGTFGYGEKRAEMMRQIAMPFTNNLIYNNSRIMSLKASDEMESGVVAWDKLRAMPAILLTSLLNSNPLKNSVYSVVYGDKETYWLAHEALHIPFGLTTGYGGAIGTLEMSASTSKVCGPLLHLDNSGNPLWFNGGLGSRTPSYNIDLHIPEYWVTESAGDKRVKWDLKSMPYCLHGVLNAPENHTHGRINKLTDAQHKITQKMVDLWIEYFQQ
ncbi:hypothetical protein MT418_001022 [Batrachochytrium dendrobatidis]